MSLFFGREERRASTPLDEWARGLDVPEARPGGRVSSESALRLGAFWSCVNLVASVVSNLPVDVVRGSGSSREIVSPTPTLVDSPSLVVSRREWTYQAMVSLLTRGNAYGYIVERDRAQLPTVIEWLNPDDVTVEQRSALHRPTYRLGGEEVNREDLVHARAFLKPGSAEGMSPVEYHAESLGVGISARDFGSRWFTDGGHPTAIFKNEDKTLKPEEASKVKQRILAVMRGRREPLVIGKGWTYEQIQVKANESQFLDAMGYSDAQVARIFGPGIAEVLGYVTSGSSLTYTNRLDRSLDLLTYAVMPWVNKLEDLLTANIARPQVVRYNVNALLRADNKTRREIYRIDREIGLHNVDELRAFEDEPPLPDGQGQDYTPLRRRTEREGQTDAG